MGYGQTFNSATDYLNFIENIYSSKEKATWNYLWVIAKGNNSENVERKRQELVTINRKIRQEVADDIGFNGDTRLRDSLIRYLDTEFSMLTDDMEQIIDLEKIAEKSYDGMEAYILAKDEVFMKMERAGNGFINAYNGFSKVHGIELSGNKSQLESRLENASQVFEYYHRVFLLFYKPFHEEKRLLNAMDSKNSEAMELHAVRLNTYANNSRALLHGFGPFRSDSSLYRICLELSIFYQLESLSLRPYSGYFSDYASYLEIKKNYEAIPEDSKKQEDVDKYNQIVKSLNSKVNTFNLINEELNRNRRILLEKWNVAKAGFLFKHILQK